MYHTSIIYGLGKCSDLMITEPKFLADVVEIEATLTPHP